MQQNERVPREKIQTSYFLNHPTVRPQAAPNLAAKPIF